MKGVSIVEGVHDRETIPLNPTSKIGELSFSDVWPWHELPATDRAVDMFVAPWLEVMSWTTGRFTLARVVSASMMRDACWRNVCFGGEYPLR